MRAVDGALDRLGEGRREEAKGEAKGKAEGRAEGKAEGRVALIVRQLTLRFGALNEGQLARISSASIEELDAIGERLLSAQSLQEALGEP